MKSYACKILFACGIGGRDDYVTLGYSGDEPVQEAFGNDTYLPNVMCTASFPIELGLYVWDGALDIYTDHEGYEYESEWTGSCRVATKEDIFDLCPDVAETLYASNRVVPYVKPEESSPGKYSDWDKW
jgi:hypothetical protein